MSETITTASPTVEAATTLSDSTADVSYHLPEEDLTIVLEDSTYYLLEEENLIWLI